MRARRRSPVRYPSCGSVKALISLRCSDTDRVSCASNPSTVVRPHLLEFNRLDPDDRAAWLGFLRVYARIVKQLDAELERAHGLSLSSYDVLVQLSLAPGDEMRMSELAAAALLGRAGITRLVERLERDGLVERHPGERDSRQVFARVTERGL